MNCGANYIFLYSHFLCLLQREETVNYLHEFVLHAALDNVDEAVWTTQSCYLKAVDRYYDLSVSAYATSSLAKFLLLHDSKNDDGIRSFFHDIHEYYIKVRAHKRCSFNTPLTLLSFFSPSRFAN